MKKETRGRPKKKPKQYSETFKKGILRALKKMQEKTGVSVYEIFAHMLYDKNIQDSVRASLWKILAEVMVVKESKQILEQINYGPAIFLPEIQKKPDEFIDIEKRLKEGSLN